jgi:hypothetical protein
VEFIEEIVRAIEHFDRLPHVIFWAVAFPLHKVLNLAVALL